MKSKTSSYIKQTLGQIRNPVPSLLSMIAKHLILVKDTHIQKYFPNNKLFPKIFPRQDGLFPRHFQTGFWGSKKRTVKLFSKSQIDFFFYFEHTIRSTFCPIKSTLRQISTFFGIWYGIRSIFQFFPLNNFLKKNFIYIIYIYLYI